MTAKQTGKPKKKPAKTTAPPASPRAEAAIRESEARLDLALRSAQMGVWHWDIVADKRAFDDQVLPNGGTWPVRG